MTEKEHIIFYNGKYIISKKPHGESYDNYYERSWYIIKNNKTDTESYKMINEKYKKCKY